MVNLNEFIPMLPGTTGSENKRKGEESSGNPAGKTRRLDVKKNQDLVVLGLPWKTTEEELKTYFEQYGEVVFSEVSEIFVFNLRTIFFSNDLNLLPTDSRS